ncbi:MAG TPA: hypothetical protein VMU89_13480 [Thermomicrobiaceae bacterium]|nr:hypothetical protein [Thermomicrobiaceae bacterium]
MHSRRRHDDAMLRRYGTTGMSYDPFAVNPIRRAAVAVAVCAFILFGGPALLGPRLGSMLLFTFGWLAATVLVFTIPVLIISVAVELWGTLRRRLHPSIDELDLNPRLRHLLQRHGYTSIDGVDRAPDGALLVLSNFDAGALREVRRAISLWKYRRWQDAGFPARGY